MNSAQMATSAGDTAEYTHDAFIMYASEDADDFAKKIHKDLEDLGFRILIAARDFMPGNTVINEMENAVLCSRKILMVLSKKFSESNFCSFEAVLAAQKGQVEGKVVSIPILYNVTKEEVPQNIQLLNYVDYHGDKEHYFKRLCDAIRAEDVHISSAMPVGNVATGLAWSYHYGYLNFILPGLADKIKESQWWNPEPSERRIAKRLFIFVPESCYCYPSFHEADDRMNLAGSLKELKHTRAGNFERSYKNTVQSVITSEGETYYFAGEYATPILSMYEMEVGNIAGLTSAEKYKQVIMFVNTLINILNHPHNGHCHDQFVIYHYKDETPDGSKFPLADKVAELIKQEISKDLQKEQNQA